MKFESKWRARASQPCIQQLSAMLHCRWSFLQKKNKSALVAAFVADLLDGRFETLTWCS